ncbi:MAG: hypothetical protein R3D33_11720 [Hyphomicrobiaceae bacterium]
MSTNGMTNWAVDLANIGGIYPFQGSEFVLAIAGIAFWIIWHIIQIRQENADIQHDLDANASGKRSTELIDRY